jgi:ADP-dependent NAD(P)H-hydrate dehydratase / NAD(P)H-hydrate epimerase
MITAYSVADVRAAERRAMASRPDGELMQRAASALAVVVADLLPRVYGAGVVLLVGPGSNGGDALWAGARLARRGARVDAVLTSDAAHPEGLAGLVGAGGRVHQGDGSATRTALARAEVVVDGLLGIGGRPGIAELPERLLDAVPDGAVVVAVDLPSGVDPDTGETPLPHLWADVTVTFGVAKPCLLLPPADQAAGRVQVADIGLGPYLRDLTPAVQQWEPADAAARWPVPGPHDDKYSRGVLGVVAGGATYTGAALLCTGAAVAAGAGMVRYVGPPPPTELVRARWPEVVPGPGRVQAWLVGPGLDLDTEAGQPEPDQLEAGQSGVEDGQRAAALDALASGLPCVVDAGALDLLESAADSGDISGVAGPLLLTPHAGELARLLSRLGGEPVDRTEVEARPLHHARAAAAATGATVLLKGATSVLAAPDGEVRSVPDGPDWLATAGSGDVLAGIAGALLAAGLDPLDAGSGAVTVHALAGERASGGGPVSAEAVLRAVPGAIADLLA